MCPKLKTLLALLTLSIAGITFLAFWYNLTWLGYAAGTVTGAIGMFPSAWIVGYRVARQGQQRWARDLIKRAHEAAHEEAREAQLNRVQQFINEVINGRAN